MGYRKGRCERVFEGHTGEVVSVAFEGAAGRVFSGASNGVGRFWLLDATDISASLIPCTQYTNAKVALVGDTGAGKTGLSLRLCEGRWEATESTHGMIVSQLTLETDKKDAVDKEVWLWDFAGQPDYRLINQLYIDETAMGIIVFDPQDDNPFDKIGYWEKALRAACKFDPAKLLVAGRCDRGGITISQKRFDEYVREHGFAGFMCTGAKTGQGCEELKDRIAKSIPWDRLTWVTTTTLFKALKDAILELSEEETPIVRLSELRQRLQLMMPQENIGEKELRTVIGLLQGQGVVQMLSFGDFVLLQPSWINCYASVAVRMAREHVDEMGVVPEQQILEGRLDYKGVKRLSEADEKILLQAMVQTFLERSLCLREQTPGGTMLVFPSYFRRERPELPEYPHVFVTYGFSGPLEEIYSTLVVRLSYSDGFSKDQLWKDAADFKTSAGKRAGLMMRDKGEGKAEIVIYFEPDVSEDMKVTFIKYVHEHLLARGQYVTRVRSYVCPHCNTPLESRKAIQTRLESGKKDISCATCDGRVQLYDLIEEKFGSDEFLRHVREMDERAGIRLDNESLELVLTGHVMAIAGQAGQICRIVAGPDWGIDAEFEFKNNKGQASGQRVYLQLKSGDSYLYHRQRDEKEVFTIKKPRHAKYWVSQAYPVMLVIRTSDGRIRWMNVMEYLKQHGTDVKQIEFEGEVLDEFSLRRMRDKMMRHDGRGE